MLKTLLLARCRFLFPLATGGPLRYLFCAESVCGDFVKPVLGFHACICQNACFWDQNIKIGSFIFWNPRITWTMNWRKLIPFDCGGVAFDSACIVFCFINLFPAVMWPKVVSKLAVLIVFQLYFWFDFSSDKVARVPYGLWPWFLLLGFGSVLIFVPACDWRTTSPFVLRTVCLRRFRETFLGFHACMCQDACFFFYKLFPELCIACKTLSALASFRINFF